MPASPATSLSLYRALLLCLPRRRRARLLLLLVPVMVMLLLALMITRIREAEALVVINNTYPRIDAPHFSERDGKTVNCVVMHATAGPTLDHCLRAFRSSKREVSAHFIVDRDGKVVQCVPVEKKAWHAGISEWNGEPGVNAYSIGIEMVNVNDGKQPYPDAQYEAVARLIRLLRTVYYLPDGRIVSHAEIALPHGRKSDPLGFDFDRLRKMLR
jgi:N-acetyl-anhydromuramyl-L-alanine amidase AmpD